MTKISVEWQEGLTPAPEKNEEQLRREISNGLLAARKAQQEWRKSGVSLRARAMAGVRHGLAGNLNKTAPLIAGERSLAEVYPTQIIPFLDACKFLQKNASRILAPRRTTRGGRPFWLGGVSHEIWREPYGVVLVVGPSNYPFFLPGVQAIQALVAGNAVMLKPGRGGTTAANVLKGLIDNAGLPGELLQVLPESPAAAVHALREGVDRLVLTGSIQAGRALLKEAAEQIVPSTVELSGWDPVFVLPDADIELAARSVAFGISINAGRTCIAPRRVFVWSEAEPAFTARLREALQDRPEICLQGETRDQIVEISAQAIEGGARIAYGRIKESQDVAGPVVLQDRPKIGIQHQTIFGPLLSIMPVNSEEEAILRSRESDLGLGASIFTRNTQAAEALAQRLDVGVVTVNDVIVPTADPRVPFGGRGKSGFGVTRGGEGLLEMTRIKVISTNKARRRPHLELPREGDAKLLAAFAALAHGRGRERWRGIKQLVKAVQERRGEV